MKKITDIEIQNFRAFFGNYKLALSEGENLLVYGENGSGKSSLFKALNNFLSSSRNTGVSFTKNHHASQNDGSIKITFSEMDAATLLPVSGSEQTLEFNNTTSTNSVQFVQDADLIKGFLDYRKLLDVYNHKEPIPNLFKLIVNDLLFEYYPIGGSESIGKKYLRLKNKLYDVRNRNAIDHKEALAELPELHREIKTSLEGIFVSVNTMLNVYFKNNLTVDFNLAHLTYNYDKWFIESDLRLILKLKNVIINDHQDILNEARLSSLATCIYLASVLANPAIFDLKILFLDDIFIGLDAGNRIPILKILLEKFQDYQVFIATYDRHWFELAQRFFNSHAHDKWSYIELYISTETVGNQVIEKPILIPYEENYDKAIYYLHHKTKPDYPAAANYFRKSAEEIMTQQIPEHEIRDENDAIVETYKLGKLVNSCLNFLDKIGANGSLLLQLKNALPSLLHPLSHYDLSSQVYKIELEEIQVLLPQIITQLTELKTNYRVLILFQFR
jgi:energy-coupling factor transporter ATP-binding protein EcfA2